MLILSLLLINAIPSQVVKPLAHSNNAIVSGKQFAANPKDNTSIPTSKGDLKFSEIKSTATEAMKPQQQYSTSDRVVGTVVATATISGLFYGAFKLAKNLIRKLKKQ
eukprot:NODE_713_length_4860_cov_0.614157.p4 type:complete len:107 gc:universal NODE_713_length_4860_cov_0.614157:3019-3339(+)